MKITTFKITFNVLKKSLLLFFLAFTYLSGFSQAIIIEEPFVRDDNDDPSYMKNQIVVKFNSDLVNKDIVDNVEIQEGLVSDFIDPNVLQMIMDSGWFDQTLADLSIKKVYTNLTTSITYSITRLGDTIEMPDFWSTFIIEYDSSIGLTFQETIDTLNTFRPWVEYAHTNDVYTLHTTPDDSYYLSGDQFGLHANTTYPDAHIDIEPAWDLTVGRDNVKVGIFDSGINWDHEDFSQDGSGNYSESRVKGGWDVINQQHISASTDMDTYGHGTPVAGIIGAIRNNNLGIAGIAGGNGANNEWGVELYDMKVMNDGYIDAFGKTTDIANFIVEGATTFNGSYGYSLNVINCSWGGDKLRQALNDAIRFSYRNSVVFVASSGNYNDDRKQYPASARDEWVMKVGNSDIDGERYSNSVYGNSLDFIAPGVNPLFTSTENDGSNNVYGQHTGTSFSAPTVSGVAGLMLSYINAPSNAPNNLAPDDVENLLQKFATDITVSPASTGYDAQTGFGRINAGATLQGIQWPQYEVKHYTYTFPYNAATKTATNVPITVVVGNANVPPGNYYGDIYEVSHTFNITQASGRTVLDVWGRNSNSTLYDIQPVIAEEGCYITSWNQTSATMKGHIFHIQTNYLGQTLNSWLPYYASGLNGNGKMALTVYSHDPLASGINDISIDGNLARIYPNPSDGDFTLMFSLLKATDLGIEVLDMTGKVVYKTDKTNTNYGHQEIKINLEHLNQGMYICNILTNEGVISKKIFIK